MSSNRRNSPILDGGWSLPINPLRIHSYLKEFGYEITDYNKFGVSWGQSAASRNYYKVVNFGGWPPSKVTTIRPWVCVSTIRIMPTFKELYESENVLGLPFHPEGRDDLSDIRTDDEARIWEKAFAEKSVQVVDQLENEKGQLVLERIAPYLEVMNAAIKDIPLPNDIEQAFNTVHGHAGKDTWTVVEKICKQERILALWYGEKVAMIAIYLTLLHSRKILPAGQNENLESILEVRSNFCICRVIADRVLKDIWRIHDIKGGKKAGIFIRDGQEERILID